MQIGKINGLRGIQNKTSVKANTTNPISKEQNHTQIKEISNLYYFPQNISFGHRLSEHKSWGAQYDPQKQSTSFTLFTFPDIQSASVKVTKPNGDVEFYPMHEDEYHRGRGRYVTGELPDVKAGDKYSYVITQANGEEVTVKDPYAMRQETLNGDSTVYDHSKYKWQDKDWMNGKNKERVSRLANWENGLKNTQSLRIYELQLDTFTNEGTYKAAAKKLKEIKDLGFNAIEIMPLDNTNSENWGYDGVDKFAPSERFGTPDELKKLIDYSHKIGLNVIIDVVPNHQGIDGNSLYSTGPYLRYRYDHNGNVILNENGKPVIESNGFGDMYNVKKEHPNYKYTRDYLANMPLNWVMNYHADGIRFDMTRYIESRDGNGPDYTLKQMVAELNRHCPNAFIIAEDGREISAMRTKLEDWENCTFDENDDRHCDVINKIQNNETDLSRIGCNSEWSFAYMHELQQMVYEAGNINKLDEFIWSGADKVKYVMSHDEQGNYEGTRFIAKLMVPKLRINDFIDQNNPDLNMEAGKLAQLKNRDFGIAKWNKTCQKAQLASEKLAIMLLEGKLEKYKTDPDASHQEKLHKYNMFYHEVLKNLGIQNPLFYNPHANLSDLITYDSIENAYEISYAQAKMANAQVFGQPGPKMIFQGDEKADMTPFRFFREFSFNPEGDKQNREIEKGYDPYEKSLKESKMGNIEYSNEGMAKINAFKKLTKDLNRINDENPALSDGYIARTIKHDGASKLHATHIKAKHANNEIFTISHFSGFDYPRYGAGSYGIVLPEGQWVEVLNTDSKEYGGKGKHTNPYTYTSNGHDATLLSVPAYSTMIFKRVG